jgi:uncharacterized protein YyaL (SSP411 family)
MALAEYIAPPPSVILRGDGDNLHAWREAMSSAYRPGTLVIALRDGLADLPETMDKPRRDGVNAWVCRGVSCLPPIGDRNELEAVLRGG